MPKSSNYGASYEDGSITEHDGETIIIPADSEREPGQVGEPIDKEDRVTRDTLDAQKAAEDDQDGEQDKPAEGDQDKSAEQGSQDTTRLSAVNEPAPRKTTAKKATAPVATSEK